MAHKAAGRRGSVAMNRLRSMRSSIAPVAPVDVASDADAADEESGFSPVVRLVAHCPVSLFAHWVVIDALWPSCFRALPAIRWRHATTGACGCPCERGRRFDARRAYRSRRGARLGFARLGLCPKRLRGAGVRRGDCFLLRLTRYAMNTLRSFAGPRRSEQQHRRSASTSDARQTPAPLACLAGYNYDHRKSSRRW